MATHRCVGCETPTSIYTSSDRPGHQVWRSLVCSSSSPPFSRVMHAQFHVSSISHPVFVRGLSARLIYPFGNVHAGVIALHLGRVNERLNERRQVRVVRNKQRYERQGFLFRKLYRRVFPTKGRRLRFVFRVEDRRRVFKLIFYLRDHDCIIRRGAASSTTTPPRTYSKYRVRIPNGDIKYALRRNRSLDV